MVLKFNLIFSAPAVLTRKEQIEALYGETMSNIAVGETVEGTVTEINKREVIVNIGYKSEGVIPASEFRYATELHQSVFAVSGVQGEGLPYKYGSRNNPEADTYPLVNPNHVEDDEEDEQGQ